MQNMLNNDQNRQARQKGFTLLELIMAIAISAILLALAVPSFTTFLNSNRVTSQANELLASLQVARMEAIRRNTRVIVCGSSNAESSTTPTCSGGNTWSGWVVYSDANSNSVIDAAEVIKVNTIYAPIEGDASNNVTNQIIFRADGFARNAAGDLLEGAVAICVPTGDPAENARDVRIDAGSRMSVTKRNGGGNCNAPDDN
jgi:type IV fimbrial biogenesis protein FimT